MIIKEKNIIYLHPGKTAGSSIERAFYPNIDFHKKASKADFNLGFGLSKKYGYLQHATINTYISIFGEEIFNNKLKISSIRNPYSRIRSIYYYKKLCKSIDCKTFKEFCNNLASRYHNLREKYSRHLLSQLLYTHRNNSRFVDKIIAMESFDDDTKFLRDKYNLKFGIVNKYKSGDYQNGLLNDYDSFNIELVRNLYRDEFEIYGYSYDIKDYWKLPEIER